VESPRDVSNVYECTVCGFEMPNIERMCEEILFNFISLQKYKGLFYTATLTQIFAAVYYYHYHYTALSTKY